MGEFNYDDVKFDPYAVEDNLLELEDLDQMGDKFYELDNKNMADLEVNIPFKIKDSAEIAQEVEDTFLSLLKDGQVDYIFTLTGNSNLPNEELPQSTINEFISLYNIAVLYNPAIKWYIKLLKIFPLNKFKINGNGLTLSICPNFFKKNIFPFLGDFKVSLRDESLIVDLIYSIAENIKDNDIQNKLQSIMDVSKNVSDTEDSDLKVENVNFSDSLFKTEDIEITSQLDDADSLGGSSFNFDNNKSVNISLQDLSNKSIAEYFIDRNTTEEEMVEKLSSEGFKTMRTNEILGIVKYIRLNKSMENNISKRTGGNINFDFKF